MAEHSHRRASSPLIGACLPPPILEDEEEEEEDGNETSKVTPPNTLPVPNMSGASRQDLCSPQFLCVDESKRPRAHSDPSVAVGGFADYVLPEITVTEDDEGGDASLAHGASRAGSHLLKESLESIRKRSNTCPEDLFRPNRKGRPATPPPTDIVPVLGGKRRTSSAGGPRRFSFNFAAPPPVAIKSPTSVSFAHHKLSKVSEDTGSECSSASGASASRERVAPSKKSSTPKTLQHTVPDNGHSSSPAPDIAARLTHTTQTSDSNDTNISPALALSSRIPTSTNGTGAGPRNLKDTSSSEQSKSQTEKTAALLGESIRTLSVADRRSCDSPNSKTNESASGLPKDSLASWRAGEKGESGHLTAV